MVLGQTGINIIINAQDKFSAVFNKAAGSLKKFQTAAVTATAIGVGIAIGFGKAIQTSIDFESAFTGVRKTVELSEKGFADLEQRFKDITKTTPITFTELSHIGELAGQLGVEGVDNLEKFTKTIADISVTTNLTAEAAATEFARIANVMQEPLDNIDRMGATVVALGNNFATSESEISTFAQRISGAGKIVGLTTADVFAIGTALSSVGIEAEAGGTAVQTALLKMDDAVIKGGDNLETFAMTAGMNSDEFAKLWENDAASAFEKFIIGLGKQGDNAQGILSDVGLGGIRTSRSFLSLANAGDLITDTLETGKTAWEDNTASSEEAAKRYGTLQSQIDIAKNKFALIGDEIGDRLTPLIENYLIPALDHLIEFWKWLGPKGQELVLTFAAVAAGLGLIAGAIAIITLVSSPWLTIIFLIAAAITLLIVYWDDVVDFVQKGIISLVMGFQILRDTLLIVWEVMKNATIIAWNFILGFIEKRINGVVSVINTLINAMNFIPGINIPIVPELNLTKFKGELTDIDTMRADLATSRLETSAELLRRSGITINIEGDVSGEEVVNKVMDGMQNKMDNMILN